MVDFVSCITVYSRYVHAIKKKITNEDMGWDSSAGVVTRLRAGSLAMARDFSILHNAQTVCKANLSSSAIDTVGPIPWG
jgi:hypothetical protein